MANMYDVLSCSSSTLPAEADDISVFLRQILLRSSSGSSSSSTLMAQKDNEMQCLTTSNVLPESQQFPVQLVSGSDRMISLAESPFGAYLALPGAHVSSSSVGTVDDEIDLEYDCESEEDLVEEEPAKPAPSRSSSKRGRAAEVHNLSEKRRRSRINEKMKALQNLIPNSNKTDKASMLDEAIEYLKQLQLQVQMLTMRNGLSLYPTCLPGALHPYQLPELKMGYHEGTESLNMNGVRALPVDQDISPSTLFSLPEHYTIPKQTSVTNNLSVLDSVTSFGWESSHVGPFQLPGSSKGIPREETLSCRHINEVHPSTSQTEYHIGGAATDMKENTLQACLLGRDQYESVRLKDLEHEAVMLPQMDGTSRRRALIKTESRNF